MKENDSLATIYDTPFEPLQYLTKVPEFADSENSTAFCDLSQVYSRLKNWRANSPLITPVLTFRRNDDPEIIRIANSFDCRFVCSSRGEAEELLAMQIPADRIQWSSSIIAEPQAEFAMDAGIGVLRVGRSSALAAIKAHHPQAKVVLIVATKDSPNYSATEGGCELGFSHTIDELDISLAMAKDMQLNVEGIALVLSPDCCSSVDEVFSRVQQILGLALAKGLQIRTLIVPEIIQSLSLQSLMEYLARLQEISQEISPDIQILCDTHDSLTTAALSIFLTVQAGRKIKDPDSDGMKVQYFVDDGQHSAFRKVYRSLRYAEVQFIRRSPPPMDESGDELFLTEIFGPSCDGNDILFSTIQLPYLSNGDLICVRNVGSDTLAMKTSFNGFFNCKVHHFIHRDHHSMSRTNL